jgi:hypothetical protein
VIPDVERVIAPVELGKGKSTRLSSDELFDVLTKGYIEAASRATSS